MVAPLRTRITGFTVSNIDIFEEDMKMESRDSTRPAAFPQHQGPFNFNIPAIFTKVDRFCPNEQIDGLFDASERSEKNLRILWDSGETIRYPSGHIDTEKHLM